MAENVLHFAGTTLRVNGTGNLRMFWFNIDETRTVTMVPLVMSLTPGNEPTKLKGFKAQRAKLRLQTTAIDEYFRINRVILWVKPVETSLPNGGH